tara:strand:+ start:119 stop:268 length:150 start_codon:yes stop_codon:yes gene_type:complete
MVTGVPCGFFVAVACFFIAVLFLTLGFPLGCPWFTLGIDRGSLKFCTLK